MSAGHAILKHWPIGGALLVQILALLGTLLVVGATVYGGIPIDPLAVPLLQGVLAAVITAMLPLARWWILLQILLPLAVMAGLVIRPPPLVWLGAFVAVWLVERNTLSERVPLYLSGRAACQALNTLLPSGAFRFVDLGCGLGGLLARLAATHPHGYFEGVESAPLPWLIARLALARRGNCRVRWGNFWELPLGEYDVIYCFLSPAPMERLWIKICAEVRPGTLLVSNTFTVPNAPLPTYTLHLSNKSGPLYAWRL